MIRDPQSLDEWQEAADAAYAMLLIDAARNFGIIVGGPQVNRERAEWILDEAAKLEIKPVSNVIDKFFRRRAFQ